MKIVDVWQGIALGIGFGIADAVFTVVTKLLGLYEFFYG